MTKLDKFIQKVKEEISWVDEPISEAIQSSMDSLIREGLRDSDDGGKEVGEEYYRLKKLRDCFKEIGE